MLVIRLRRIGRKHDPHYRIVVTEHTAPVQGKFLAEIGHYHPKSKEFGIDKDAFMSWLNKGAQPSNTVARLAQRNELEHKQITVKTETGKPKAKAQELAAKKAEKAAAPAPVETPAEEEATVEADASEETTTDEPATDVADVETPAETEEVATEETSEEAAA